MNLDGSPMESVEEPKTSPTISNSYARKTYQRTDEKTSLMDNSYAQFDPKSQEKPYAIHYGR